MLRPQSCSKGEAGEPALKWARLLDGCKTTHGDFTAESGPICYTKIGKGMWIIPETISSLNHTQHLTRHWKPVLQLLQFRRLENRKMRLCTNRRTNTRQDLWKLWRSLEFLKHSSAASERSRIIFHYSASSLRWSIDHIKNDLTITCSFPSYHKSWIDTRSVNAVDARLAPAFSAKGYAVK